MISRDLAIRITSKNFPKGPENLADHLGIEIQVSALVGVEGWCVRGDANTIIRVSSSSSRFRQRFTLSHELAHLVLGTSPDIAVEPFSSNRKEESDADSLASEFLIPTEELQSHIRGRLPVDAKTLERLAKAANVSPVVAACRVVSSTDELDLQNAAVVFFIDGAEQWRYSRGLSFGAEDARELYQLAKDHKPNPVREDNKDGNVVVGSIIDAQVYQVLLIQLLPKDKAARETYEEEVRKLAKELFGDDNSFRQSVAARLGIVKNECASRDLEYAVEYFYEKYGTAYTGVKATAINSVAGRKYVQLRLERWFDS